VTLFPGPSLDELRNNAAKCTACDLYKEATRTVFGEGPPDARLVLIGEVPGDKETSPATVRRPRARCATTRSGRGHRSHARVPDWQ
jgi:hypothetical protein